MIAGKNTAEKMLYNWGGVVTEEDYEEEDVSEEKALQSEIRNITEEERVCLIKFIETLNANKEKDPKYKLLLKLFVEDNWIERGCIIFFPIL